MVFGGFVGAGIISETGDSVGCSSGQHFSRQPFGNSVPGLQTSTQNESVGLGPDDGQAGTQSSVSKSESSQIFEHLSGLIGPTLPSGQVVAIGNSSNGVGDSVGLEGHSKTGGKV